MRAQPPVSILNALDLILASDPQVVCSHCSLEKLLSIPCFSQERTNQKVYTSHVCPFYQIISIVNYCNCIYKV